MAGFVGVISLIFWNYYLFASSYVLGGVFALTLAIYLPVLFIYKLYQINSNVISEISVTKSDREPSMTASASRPKRTADINGDNAILTVIRKCTILTVISLISSWCIFICVLIAIISGSTSYGLLVFWGTAIILDSHANFICVMLSNSFCDEYYVKICGCIDKCVGQCCFNDHPGVRVGSTSPQEKELSSYMETMETKSSKSSTSTA